ncbi:hypothetical protein TrVE_jg7408 [Triparma verrucosa]|uniref:Uncharacterized protein n=1 Tax=Triparma verrucosa TaxID=1606542 RepID=A0A9W7FCX1_9STRA|nr:hypothetical protein TrVE_jg7408 [Triparma verrucosa]
MTSSEPPSFLPHPLILPDTTTRGLEAVWTLGQNALSALICSLYLPQKVQAPPRSYGLELTPTGELDVEYDSENEEMARRLDSVKTSTSDTTRAAISTTAATKTITEYANCPSPSSTTKTREMKMHYSENEERARRHDSVKTSTSDTTRAAISTTAATKTITEYANCPSPSSTTKARETKTHYSENEERARRHDSVKTLTSKFALKADTTEATISTAAAAAMATTTDSTDYASPPPSTRKAKGKTNIHCFENEERWADHLDSCQTLFSKLTLKMETTSSVFSTATASTTMTTTCCTDCAPPYLSTGTDGEQESFRQKIHEGILASKKKFNSEHYSFCNLLDPSEVQDLNKSDADETGARCSEMAWALGQHVLSTPMCSPHLPQNARASKLEPNNVKGNNDAQAGCKGSALTSSPSSSATLKHGGTSVGSDQIEEVGEWEHFCASLPSLICLLPIAADIVLDGELIQVVVVIGLVAVIAAVASTSCNLKVSVEQQRLRS